MDRKSLLLLIVQLRWGPFGSPQTLLAARLLDPLNAALCRLEDIPVDPATWDVPIRGAAKLGATLQAQFDDALLFRLIATINTDAPTITDVEELRWTGPRPEVVEIAERLDAPGLAERAVKLADTDKRSDLKSDEAIARLETVSVIWRGGRVEIESLAELNRLYTDQQRWRDAFLVARRDAHRQRHARVGLRLAQPVDVEVGRDEGAGGHVPHATG